MTGLNPYPNGILIVPIELLAYPESPGDDLLAIACPIPAVVRLPAALIPNEALPTAVLAGEACVRCGSSLGEMVPCGPVPQGTILVHDPLCED